MSGLSGSEASPLDKWPAIVADIGEQGLVKALYRYSKLDAQGNQAAWPGMFYGSEEGTPLSIFEV